jgi:hypothetical protein
MKVHSAIVVLALEFGLLMAPVSSSSAQNPLVALENAAKEKAAEQALETLLNNQLPLMLNANNVYPSVNQLPGGPFSPTLLKLTAGQLNQPLPPGDYTINTLDFCSEYSVHEPGAGVAYVLGPYQGKAAGAISALIWRGTVQYRINPNSLQAVSWSIQSGLPYMQMPKTYQAIIDQVIPDFKNQLASDFFVNLQTSYNTYARTAKLPSLDAILAKLGKPGELALSAERQRAILTRQNTNDQIRDQTLFQGQQAGLYTPVKEENGPWTERVKGQVYMKLQIVGGNMSTNNVMMIRVMPPPMTNSRNAQNRPRMVLASYGEPQAPAGGTSSATSVTSLMGGMIGYSQGRGAQALGQVPVVAPGSPSSSAPVGKVTAGTGNLSIIRAGTTTPVPLKPGDLINQNDTLVTGPDGSASAVFADNTQMTLAANTKIVIDNYVYDPSGNQSNQAQYRVLQGAFQYVSGLISKPNNADVRIHTDYGCLGIRGTELVAKLDLTAKSLTAYLIEGAVSPGLSTEAVHTAPPVSGPLQIIISPSGVKTVPMSQAQYNAIKAQVLPLVPVS